MAAAPSDLDRHPAGRVADPAGKPSAVACAVDERPEADALHDAAHDDRAAATGASRRRRRGECDRQFRSQPRRFPAGRPAHWHGRYRRRAVTSSRAPSAIVPAAAWLKCSPKCASDMWLSAPSQTETPTTRRAFSASAIASILLHQVLHQRRFMHACITSFRDRRAPTVSTAVRDRRRQRRAGLEASPPRSRRPRSARGKLSQRRPSAIASARPKPWVDRPNWQVGQRIASVTSKRWTVPGRAPETQASIRNADPAALEPGEKRGRLAVVLRSPRRPAAPAAARRATSRPAPSSPRSGLPMPTMIRGRRSRSSSPRSVRARRKCVAQEMHGS